MSCGRDEVRACLVRSHRLLRAVVGRRRRLCPLTYASYSAPNHLSVVSTGVAAASPKAQRRLAVDVVRHALEEARCPSPIPHPSAAD